jgi:hypothetical protein
MSSPTPVNGVGYDKSLLADAPEVTKADKQVSLFIALLTVSIADAMIIIYNELLGGLQSRSIGARKHLVSSVATARNSSAGQQIHRERLKPRKGQTYSNSCDRSFPETTVE